MPAHLDRAYLLYHQSRYDLAEKELRPALAADPDDAPAHALLALCLVNQKKLDPATEEAERAVACGPGLPATHFALATVRYFRRHYPEAGAAVAEALRLDPAEPDYYALLAMIRGEAEDWRGALAAADGGLEHDPEHAGCVNLRAMALVKLGRRDDAGAAIEGALARDPDDAFTHANRGWAYLHEGDPKNALDHFREALRLDPELEYARGGMIEAMKARYWVYRQILGYFLWMSRLSPRARWGVILGLVAGQQVLARAGEANPGLAPFVEPILIAYLGFAVTTWTAIPLSNFFLRLNRFGRLALSRDQRVASNWVAGCLTVALAGLTFWALGPREYDFVGFPTAMTFLIMVLPLSATFGCAPGWPRRVMGVYTAGMFVAGVAGLGLIVSALAVADTAYPVAVERIRNGFDVLKVHLWAGFLSGFVANALMRVRPRL